MAFPLGASATTFNDPPVVQFFRIIEDVFIYAWYLISGVELSTYWISLSAFGGSSLTVTSIKMTKNIGINI